MRNTKEPDDEKKIRDARMFYDKEETMDLRHAYVEAKAKNKKEFIFKGEILSVAYAKYLITYLTQNGY